MPWGMDVAAPSPAPAQLSPPLLPQLLAPIRRRWWLMPAGVLLIWALVFLKLNMDPMLWSAEIRLFPAPDSSGVAPRRGLAGLAAQTGGGLAAIAGLGGEAAPPFNFLLDGLANPDVAARLAKDPAIMQMAFPGEWDKERGAWRAPEGLSGKVQRGLYGLVGLPVSAWSPPDALRLQAYISKTVMVRRSVKSPLVTLTHEHWDRAFAARFLDQLVAVADDELRRQTVTRTAGNIAYLSARLDATTQAEARTALVEALAEEERSAMLASARLPYAAEVFAPATAGRWPTRPRPLPLLAAGLVAGLLLGAALAVWLDRRKPQA